MFRAFAILLGVVAACHGKDTETDTGATTTGADTAVSSPDPDVDGDGFGASVDCDDTDPLVHPHASENCRDGVDQDCDSRVDEDCSTDYADAVLFDPSIGNKQVQPFVGDINRDGYADVVSSATTFDTADPDPGVITVTWGRPDFAGSVSADLVISGRNGDGGSGRIGRGSAVLSEGDGSAWLVTSTATSVLLWRDLPNLPASITVDQADAVLGDATHPVYGLPVAGDFEGDGRADVWVDSWQGLVIYSADELAQAHPDSAAPFARLSGARKLFASTGDLDGDGLDELIDAGGSPGVDIYSGEGLTMCGLACAPDRTIGELGSIGFGLCVGAPEDVDGDGALDLVASALGENDDGEVFALPGVATRVDQAFGVVASDSVVGSDLWGAGLGGAGDVDGDGQADVAVWGNLPETDTSAYGRICLVHGADLMGTQTLAVAADCVDPSARTRGTLYGPTRIFGDIDGDSAVDLVASVDSWPSANYTYVFSDWGVP